MKEIKEPRQLKLSELNLFKLAQNDSFGSNIGVQFLTYDQKPTMILAKSIAPNDVMKQSESNSMTFLYPEDPESLSKVRSIVKCYCCAILFQDA